MKLIKLLTIFYKEAKDLNIVKLTDFKSLKLKL